MQWLLSTALMFSFSAFALDQVQTERLIEAIRRNDVIEAREAIRKGADVNSLMREHFEVPLIIRAASHNQPEMLQLLLENKANVNATRPSDGNNALMIAARGNNVEVARVLLESKININFQVSTARTVLDVAANMNSLEVGRLIIAQDGVDMNNRMPFNCPLSIAARDNHVEFMKMLLEQEGDKAPSEDCIELARRKAEKFKRPEASQLLNSDC